MTAPHCVYVLTFPSGKSYVGIAKNFERRWSVHKHMALSGKSNLAVHCAMRKYGVDAVKRRVLLIGSYQYVRDMEVRTIAALLTQAPLGYNVTPGGDGVVHTDAMRYKQSLRLLERATPEYRETMRLLATGRKMTPEQNERNRQAKLRHWADPLYRAKLVSAHTGVAQTVESRSKRSVSMRAAWENTEHREKVSKAMTGRKIINNGIEQKLSFVVDGIPDGWTLGMLESHRKALRKPKRKK